MRLLAAGDCILWREISYCGLFNGNTGRGWAEQLRLTPSQLGGCSTAWYIICGREGETRTLIITETRAMAAVLSALCSGSKRIRPALRIYMMAIAARLALCLRTQIINKNIATVHNRTLFFICGTSLYQKKIYWPFWLLALQLLCLSVTFLQFPLLPFTATLYYVLQPNSVHLFVPFIVGS